MLVAGSDSQQDAQTILLVLAALGAAAIVVVFVIAIGKDLGRGFRNTKPVQFLLIPVCIVVVGLVGTALTGDVLRSLMWGAGIGVVWMLYGLISGN